MLTSLTARGIAGLAVCCAGLGSAHALERVTLRSGFTVECSHHELVGDHVRLYTGKGSDYQELSILQVANIEFLPDQPKPIVLAKPASAAAVATYSATPAAPATATAAAVTTLQPAPLTATAYQPSELDVHTLLIHAGAEHNIDVELLASVIHAESGYKVRAISRAGARGLMQLMPATARNFGAHDLFKAEENIAAGTAFLDELLKRYNDNLALALAAYNAGPGAVERYHGIPPFRETRAYVTRVITEFYRRKVALGAAATPAPPVEAAAPAPGKALQTASFQLASAPAPLRRR